MYTTKIHFNIILHRVSVLYKLSLSTKLLKQTWIWICCFQKGQNFVNTGSLEVAQQNLKGNTGLNVIRSSIASIRMAPNTECSCCYQGKQPPPQIVRNECLPWSTVHRRMGPNDREGNPSFGSMDPLSSSFQASLVYKRVDSPRGLHSTVGRYILPVHGSHKPVSFMRFQLVRCVYFYP